MKLGRILFPVKNLGPGNRLGIWLKGCSRGCKGCANPELWDASKDREIPVDIIREVIKQLREGNYPEIDGVTISGGEPFEQPETLRELIAVFWEEGLEDILLFSGYQLVELQENYPEVVSEIAVLVDGPYKEERNEGHPLKGSANQTIHYLKEKYRKNYEEYILKESGRKTAQMFPVLDGKIATGIHEKDFQKEFERKMLEKV